ncbi:hypothetical protein BSKO_10745 [Bryopsis sp. KO-2023]|nr:hypothetical protein BSKO_10745 [Bryopsis sp. KO-2023]
MRNHGKPAAAKEWVNYLNGDTSDDTSSEEDSPRASTPTRTREARRSAEKEAPKKKESKKSKVTSEDAEADAPKKKEPKKPKVTTGNAETETPKRKVSKKSRVTSKDSDEDKMQPSGSGMIAGKKTNKGKGKRTKGSEVTDPDQNPSKVAKVPSPSADGLAPATCSTQAEEPEVRWTHETVSKQAGLQIASMHFRHVLPSGRTGEQRLTPKRVPPPFNPVVEQQILGILREAYGAHMDEADARSAIRETVAMTDKSSRHDLGELASQVAVAMAVKQSERESAGRARVIVRQGDLSKVVDLNGEEDFSIQMEIRHMRTAMAESLKESELDEMTVVPLKDRPIEELLVLFAHSVVMEKIDGEIVRSDLFIDECKEKSAQFFAKEKECLRWFPCPGTMKYFRIVGKKLRKLIRKEAEPPELNAFMENQTEKLVAGYSKLPSVPGKLPNIFADLQTGDETCIETCDLIHISD